MHELASRGVRVLSPADPRVVAAQGEFLFVASDKVRSVRLVQDRHLESIKAADFLWLVSPDGYVGLSASMEIGYAAGAGIPVFATRPPTDLTLREYVTVVPSLSDALRIVEASPSRRRAGGLLINPNATVEEAHDLLEQMRSSLNATTSISDPAADFYAQVSQLKQMLGDTQPKLN